MYKNDESLSHLSKKKPVFPQSRVLVYVFWSLVILSLLGCDTGASPGGSTNEDIYVYFSPDDMCDEQVIAIIDKATQVLDIAVFSFTKQNIANAVVRAHQRKVKIRVITDANQASSDSSKDTFLEKEGIQVRRDKHSGIGLMHHKFAVIDNQIVITGSYNWTSNATTSNDENLLVIFSETVAKQYSKEFERVWEHHIQQSSDE